MNHVIKQAQEFYRVCGYAGAAHIYRDITVPGYILNITNPIQNNLQDIMKEYKIASGEQMLLNYIHRDKIVLNKVAALTKCYRPYDEGKTKYHFGEFTKLELMNHAFDRAPTHKELQSMINVVKFFHEEFLGLDTIQIQTQDEERWGCETLISYDLFHNKIEIGSYGIRFNHVLGHWIYGTGLAFERVKILLDEKVTLPDSSVLKNQEQIKEIGLEGL